MSPLSLLSCCSPGEQTAPAVLALYPEGEREQQRRGVLAAALRSPRRERGQFNASRLRGRSGVLDGHATSHMRCARVRPTCRTKPALPEASTTQALGGRGQHGSLRPRVAQDASADPRARWLGLRLLRRAGQHGRPSQPKSTGRRRGRLEPRGVLHALPASQGGTRRRSGGPRTGRGGVIPNSHGKHHGQGYRLFLEPATGELRGR